MHSLKTIDALSCLEGPIHLAIGVFDGVHLGHQAVLASAIRQARLEGGLPVAATFDPHPAEVLAPDKAPKRLTPLAHQEVIFARLGMAATLAIPFNGAMAKQTPADFVRELTGACNLASVQAGLDWTFGKARQGNVSSLREFGEHHGFVVQGVAPVLYEGVRISSSAVRRAVEQGDLARAERLLGRPFSLYGTVTRGDQLGRKLGFPTANIGFTAQALPPHGVYIVRLPSLDDRPGVANLGVRPTLGGNRVLTFEVHVLDWAGDIYGESMEVELLSPLRPERPFDSLERLREQIARDVNEARRWLAGKEIPLPELTVKSMEN